MFRGQIYREPGLWHKEANMEWTKKIAGTVYIVNVAGEELKLNSVAAVVEWAEEYLADEHSLGEISSIKDEAGNEYGLSWKARLNKI